MMIDRDRVCEALTGPISSIRTPFTKDGAVDFDGLRNTLDFNIEAGSKTMLLTAGDSHYIALSDQEIAEVSRLVVEHTAGRAMVVTADRYYHTKQAIEFARYVAEIGTDVHMVLPPDWGASCTSETLCEHYAQVAEHISVMVVTGVFSPRGEEFGLRTLELVKEQVENVVAIKDDMLGTFARKMTLLVHDKWAVFAGGQKQNHMDLHPYGCDGFMSTFITFKPEITHQYWAAIQANNVREAATIIRDYDHPFFDLLRTFTGGFDAALHGVFELFGIYERWR
ncbi:MAG: dihydrodipicolinate synthase family protein, partial [Candidatus Latescibacteria bacterium]|nr:dihydrodipicolinate synthase family protein [Candidatus Latescibacterota bacterium]